ncbi:MAG TPA: transcription termination/antitermination protein NusG [Fimbriiglobus sp.]|nr:transcription termination/antitermination protein NusG [Fimbriiglobus sp.]
MTADDPTPQPTDDEPPTPDAEVVEANVADEAAPEEPPAPAEPANGAAPAETPPPATNKKWYIIKVTSGREESIKAAIERRVKIEGLEEFFGQIHIPVERVTEIKKVKETKNGEKVTKERRVTKEKKKFPGYIMAEVEFNDRILYLFRETSGVGDFVGAGGPGKPPPPMTEIEVKRMLGEAVPDDRKPGHKIKVKLDFEKGDKVRIREGAFSNMEGEVKEITEPKEAGDTPKVTVEVQIFGRPVGVELDYWQVDRT